jgi:hypothetical protein
MDLAMVKQEQGETLRKYMRHFFDKRATVVDVTDKEVIDLFQDGLYHRRTFEDFGRRRPRSIPHLKDMITSWADEEDKANAKYDAIRGKTKQNAGGGSGSNANQGGRNNYYYSGPNRKRKPDNTAATIQRPAKENPKKNSGSFKDLLKEKCPWHPNGNHNTEQCYQLRHALKDTPEPLHPHDKKGKKKDGDNNDSQEANKTVNVLFGGLPSKREQKASGSDLSQVVGGTHYLLPRGSMDQLLRTRTVPSRPKASGCGLQTQQGPHRRWKRAQRPFHQDLEEDKARHHPHAHQEQHALLRHRPR